jgi:hypothetical protein
LVKKIRVHELETGKQVNIIAETIKQVEPMSLDTNSILIFDIGQMFVRESPGRIYKKMGKLR